MVKTFEIRGVKEAKEGTYLKILIPKESLTGEIKKLSGGRGLSGLIKFDDGRFISSEQQRKAYATMGDMADYLGYEPEHLKEILKYYFCGDSGEDYFSLSNCSVTTARSFITYLLKTCLEQDIHLKESALCRTDDIDAYLYMCLKNRKCCICGKPGQIHHVDAIGMGNDRKTLDDSKKRKICLDRQHHQEAHTIGNTAFEEKYHVYGIMYNEE